MIAVAERPAQPVAAAAHLEELSIDLVDVGDNVRIDPGELEGLAATIREHGVIQAVGAVGPDAAGRYSLVFGQRRLLASKLAGRTTIPTIVRSSAEAGKPGAQRSLEQLVENLERADLNPIDEAQALQDILDADKKLTQAGLATYLGRSAPWVANTLGLLRAPKQVREFVQGGALTAAHARAIAGLPADMQVRLAKAAVDHGTSAHSLEETAQWERRSQRDDANKAKLTEAAAVRGIAALEKAGIAKDARLYVYAGDWRVQDADVRKAIKAAGYTNVVDGWLRTGERWSKCDCTAVQLNIHDGDGSKITPGCTNEKHWRAVESELRARQDAKAKDAEAERKRLGGFVRAAMPAELNPTIGRLLLRAIDGYSAKPWTEYSKIADGKVTAALAEKLTAEHVLRGGYGDGKPLPLKTVLRELGAVDADPAAKPARAKKPKADA